MRLNGDSMTGAGIFDHDLLEYRYKKAGVMLMDLAPVGNQQSNLFNRPGIKNVRLSHVVDNLNSQMGKARFKWLAPEQVLHGQCEKVCCQPSQARGVKSCACTLINMSNTGRLLFGILALLVVLTSHADTLTGRVVGVSDGDTLTLLEEASNNQYKIRLAGIDSPEKRQAYGKYCKQSLSDLTYDQIVTVEWKKRDKYGRIIGKVITAENDVNLEQINRGCGWHYKKYQHEQSLSDQNEYRKTEELARNHRIGLWSEAMPIPPWEWRSQ